MEMNEIKNIIENNATERKLYEKRLYETMSSLDILKTEKRKLENSVLLDITQEKNEDGKPIYTNEKMRESEQNKRLAHNTAYIEILTKETELNKEISDLKIEIDFLRRKQMVLRIAGIDLNDPVQKRRTIFGLSESRGR